MSELPEYPRTLHLGDSGGQQSKHHCPFAEVAGLHLAVDVFDRKGSTSRSRVRTSSSDS